MEMLRKWSLGLSLVITIYEDVVWCKFCAWNVLVKYMNRIFHNYLDKFAVVFIEDILIYFKIRGKTYRVLDN